MLDVRCRADGNSRLWSGGDNQAANERVRRSQQDVPVWYAVLGPGIPCLLGMGSGQEAVFRTERSDFTVEHFAKQAPVTTNNFVFLALAS
jgi:hypothetical protein